MTSGLLAERNGRYGMSESAKASTSMELGHVNAVRMPSAARPSGCAPVANRLLCAVHHAHHRRNMVQRQHGPGSKAPPEPARVRAQLSMREQPTFGWRSWQETSSVRLI